VGYWCRQRTQIGSRGNSELDAAEVGMTGLGQGLPGLVLGGRVALRAYTDWARGTLGLARDVAGVGQQR
jgi:hypothetical protein